MSVGEVRVVGLDAAWLQAPLIVAANHQSPLDVAILRGHLPQVWKLVALRANRPVLRCALRAGRSVLLFPERGVTPDGRVGAFDQLAASLALQLDKPLVPIAIRGSFGADLADAGPRTMLVRVGPPLPTRGEDAASLTESLRDAIVGLLHEDAGTWFHPDPGEGEVAGWRGAWQASIQPTRPGARERRPIWG